MSSPGRRGARPAVPAGGARRAPASPASPAAAAASGSQPASPAAAGAGADADEDRDADDFDRVVDDEESEGEDLMDEDQYRDDYKAVDELDRYESEGIDEEEDYEEIGAEARRRAEQQMLKRDREDERRTGRRPTALDSPIEDEPTAPERRRRRIASGAVGVDENGNPISPSASAAGEDEAMKEEEEEGPVVNLDDFKGPLQEWIALDATRKEIKRRFRHFLTEYKGDKAVPIYPALMVTMGTYNRSSLEVSFIDLSNAYPVLAVWLADEPQRMIELFDEEAQRVTSMLYPNYSAIADEVHVRITGLPIVDKLRELRQHHLQCLIRVEGVVTRRSGVFPQLQKVTYNCGKCRAVTGPYIQNGQSDARPTRCAECQSQGPFIVNTQETIYRNYQKITLQEAPGSVPAGRVPRQKEVILLHDLIDSVSPGELVDVTGIYMHTYDASLNNKNGFPVFHTVIQANYVTKQAETMASFRLTDEDKEQILKLSKVPNVAELIINSIGPSIYGHSDVKTALALAMFSGEAKQFANGHRIRGDINVLVLGDPGTAKSQFLKYTEKTAHRAVYTTGKGASAVGLTASVHKDPLTREWTLEGGALVLADQGTCLIDEFDKMNDADRTSIHEAMEQQSISISKAGIITTLKARCSVIAAANPVQGRYDSSKTFAENVELTDAILSRFDILCVVRDQVDYEVDSRLASFVVDSHVSALEYATATAMPNSQMSAAQADPATHNPNLIPQALLKKYILFARQNCHPKLTKIDGDKISRLYSDLRRESMVTGGIPIAVRHIEGIIRMSEAHAKMHLREYVLEEDVNVAIRVMLESFISSQKFAVMRPLRAHFDKYLTYKKDQFELLLFALHQLVNDALQVRVLRGSSFEEAQSRPVEIETDEFRAKAQELNISVIEPFLVSDVFQRNGFKLDRARKFIIKTFA